ITRCQWGPGYASWTAVVGIPALQFPSRRFCTSSGGVPSGGNGTKKWPCSVSLNAGGRLYDATARIGRWKGGDGSTVHRSPFGSVTRPVSRRNARAFSVHSSYSCRIPSGVGAWILFSRSQVSCHVPPSISFAIRFASAESRSHCSRPFSRSSRVPNGSISFSRGGGFGELALGAESMKEEREDAVQPRVQVRRRLPAPHLQRLSDLTAAQDRDEQVAVDALRRREPIVRDRAKAAEPRVVGVDAGADRRFTDIVEPLVVFGEAQARREGGRVVVLLLQERIDERRERRRQGTPSFGRAERAPAPAPGQWAGAKREPHRVPAQTRLQTHARAEGQAAQGGALASLRGAPT